MMTVKTLRPPYRSASQPAGIRRIEPHSTGTAASSSTWVSDQPLVSWRCLASGATSPQLVKQIVNAIVASARLRVA
jgi:hypothetical protein